MRFDGVFNGDKPSKPRRVGNWLLGNLCRKSQEQQVTGGLRRTMQNAKKPVYRRMYKLDHH